ncbi:MAG TPA: hypothetical protein VI451_17840, partial [Anaerolineales bacterium]|nr:hypothetical protein [Anaerolineales bacterium]
PRPEDLTPADTSSYLVPDFAGEIRKFHPNVEEIITALNPSDEEIAAHCAQAQNYALLIAATINAINYPGQANLINTFANLSIPLIAIATRNPSDLYTFPHIPTYLCTYSIQPPSIQAVVEGLFGQIPISGKLPVTLPDL